jgi:hypothetical protein
MKQQAQCEFLVVRYAPDAVKGEFVNIGVVLLNEASGTAEVQFTRDWRRVRCLDPMADTEMLESVETELRERLRAGGADRERILHLLRDSFANALQVSAPKGLLTDAPQQELTRLLEIYAGRTRRGRRRETAGRTAIVRQMRSAFEQTGVWPAMFKEVRIAQYTHPGDPLRIDCGYRPNGILKFFHAVPLATDVDAAKVLAFSYPQVRDGVTRVEGCRTELTAVVEPNLPHEDQEVAFAMEMLRRNAIQIAGTDELPRLAESARREMRL